MSIEPSPIAESGALTLSDAAWTLARTRAAVIRELADFPNVPQQAAENAAVKLGLSTRHVYRLIKVWRASGGNVATMAPLPPSGGRGKPRKDEAVEAVVSSVITSHYLTRQKPQVTSAVKEVRRQCRLQGLTAPCHNTIAARIDLIRPDRAAAKREGSKAAFKLQPAPGVTPKAERPLDVIQIDHTMTDIQLVDPKTRQPLGRAFLTVAIDGFSRCILGICITLDPPSATSVGLCLAHVATDKKPWLEKLGVDCTWPMRGKPKKIYVDNGREFHSEAMRRGCEVHGIQLDHRPVARPHYGGIMERVIGTMMNMVHELPGTTFSNIQERGKYDSDVKAVMTLQEFEKWLVLAICGPYHNEAHGTLLQPPAAKWSSGVAQFGEPPTAQNPKAFLIDFLPIDHRRIQRQGFVLDHIGYYASALSPWIAERERVDKFAIRRDPRDLSRIWVLDPKQSSYIEVPYRTLSNPPITLWEHRAAQKRLREEGRKQVDEQAIFRAVEQMRSIVDDASQKSRAARRNQARRPDAPEPRPMPELPTVSSGDAATPAVAAPFADIEEW